MVATSEISIMEEITENTPFSELPGIDKSRIIPFFDMEGFSTEGCNGGGGGGEGIPNGQIKA